MTLYRVTVTGSDSGFSQVRPPKVLVGGLNRYLPLILR